MAANKYLVVWRQEQRLAGRCIDCCDMGYRGGVRCLRHSLATNEARRRRKELLRAAK